MLVNKKGFTLIEVVFSALLVSGIIFGATILLLMGNNVFSDSTEILTAHEQARNLELFLHDNLAKANDVLLSNTLLPADNQQTCTSFQISSQETNPGLTVYLNGNKITTFESITNLAIYGNSNGARCIVNYSITSKAAEGTTYEIVGSAVLNNFKILPDGISTSSTNLSEDDFLSIIIDNT